MTDLDIRTDNVLELSAGEPILAHIIDRGNDERKAADIILEARVMGTTLTALCGHKWVPERDPKKYPVCEKCKELVGFAAQFYNKDDRPIQ